MAGPAASAETASDRPDEEQLSKKERGRLKKLRKRATEVRNGCETTGIASLDDWKEYCQLVQRREPPYENPPSVSVRFRSSASSIKTEGSHHRNILARLLRGEPTETRKRKRASLQTVESLPTWATLHNVVGMEHVVVIELEIVGLDWETVLDTFKPFENAMIQCPTRWFQGHIPKSMTDELLYSSISQKNLGNQGPNIRNLHDLTEELSSMVLTRSQLDKEGFPLPVDVNESKAEHTTTLSASTAPGLIPLEQAKQIVQAHQVSVAKSEQPHVPTGPHNDASPRILALDCEMVTTKAGSELARVTLLQLHSLPSNTKTKDWTLLLDELVQPYRPVLDYVTRYSGITKALLDPVATRLEQIQATLRSLISAHDILIGHSLENDLNALQMVHTTVVDTAILFQTPSRKYSLKHLSAALLKRRIQTNQHCSEEDAAATLHLAVRRAMEGPSFGILESKRHSHLPAFSQTGTTVFVGPTEWLKEHVVASATAVHALSSNSIMECCRPVQAWCQSPNSKRRARLVWTHLQVEQESSLHEWAEWLETFGKTMSPTTVLMVALQREYDSTRELCKRRKACRDPRSTCGWPETMETKWKNQMKECQSGFVMWMGKSNTRGSTSGGDENN